MNFPLKILSTSQIRQADFYTIKNESIKSIDLMERAALKCFEWIQSKYDLSYTFYIFCGSGNNGGDGLAIARMLAFSKYKVYCYQIKLGNNFSNDFLVNKKRLEIKLNSIKQIKQFPEIKNKSKSIIIDSILGSGLNRNTSGFLKEIILDETETIDEILISPVVDIKDIMEKEINANEIRALFENLEYEDGFSVTEGFKSDYDYHLITLKVSNNSSLNTVSKIIDYFNRNPLFAKLKDRNLQRISSVIYDNEQTIKQIDKIIDFYTTEKKVSSAQLYIDNKDIRPNDLINTKVVLQKENEDLKNVLGIQGQLWSETITNKDVFDEMINPILATLAEIS